MIEVNNTPYQKFHDARKQRHCQSFETCEDSLPEAGVVGPTGHTAVQAKKAKGEKTQNQGAAALFVGARRE